MGWITRKAKGRQSNESLRLTMMMNRLTMSYLDDMYDTYEEEGNIPGKITIDVDGYKADICIDLELIAYLYERIEYDTNKIINVMNGGNEDVDLRNYTGN